ncbi:uncharacterized protein At5g65660 [Selaginella moellendorffii]|uniref:uncharacterized protein At5g65660 n=1 Tax=Selaginella moellendorffii TaxID=88036 RepID=UPI000D1C8A87|nr:uncharacterized protein At5g65660 [Selaginella moellendorffii]|eukprot:XP_024539702.1 uncharacterized protein At5g65660 [Selaginella moellendorffii]
MAARILVLMALLEEGYGSRGMLEDLGNAHRRVPEEESSAPPPASSSIAASGSAATRPALGFPLGTALILFLVFGVSTLFSCCYHWEKIRSHTGRLTANRSSAMDSSATSSSAGAADGAAGDRCCEIDPPKCTKQSLILPVLMPGDQIPRYVAWPSPHGIPDEAIN